MAVVVVYGGGFQPFHAGHLSSYVQAKRAFPDAEFFVAASNDVKQRPIPFKVKKFLAQQAGVKDAFVEVSQPLNPKEILKIFDPNKDIFVLVRSERDPMPYTRKDGSPAYFQPFVSLDQCEPFGKHAYILVTKKHDFIVNGQEVYSGSQVRDMYTNADDATKEQIISQLYPKSSHKDTIKQVLDQYLQSTPKTVLEPKVSAAKQLKNKKLAEMIRKARPLLKEASIEKKAKFLKLLKESVQEGFYDQTIKTRNKIAQQTDPARNKFVWKRPNQISGSHTEQELLQLGFRKSTKNNVWGGTQDMWNRLSGSLNELAPNGGSGGDGDDRYIPPNYGKPYKSRYLGKNEFEITCATAPNDPSKDIKLKAIVQKYGLEWDDDDEIWFLDSPGAVWLGWQYGEIPLPKAIDQVRNPGHIHDLVSDWLNSNELANLQQIAINYFGFTDDGEMNEGAVVPFKQPSKTLTWQQVPRDILLLANDWFWASEDNSGLDATIDPEGFGNGTANEVKYIAAKLQQKGWTIDRNDEHDDRYGPWHLVLRNNKGQSVLLDIEDAQTFTGWAKGTSQYDLEESYVTESTDYLEEK